MALIPPDQTERKGLDGPLCEMRDRHNRALAELPTIASQPDIDLALQELPYTLPNKGLDDEKTKDLLARVVAPALAPGQAGPRYYGFVTGGTTPIAQHADMLTTLYDTNNQVNLPNETIAAHLEYLALLYVLALLSLSPDAFTGRTITTGATASNVLGLSLGREHGVRKLKQRQGILGYSVAENGIDVPVRVYCAGAHASIAKAAAILGIGRSNVVEVVDLARQDTWVAFDLARLQALLERDRAQGAAAILVASIGEVNTGHSTPDMAQVRALADKHDAWLHIDAAFGGFYSLHPAWKHLSADLALADSITTDAHKALNVPYDAALFFCRDATHLVGVCGPGASGGAAYLTPATTATDPSATSQLAQLRQLSASHPSPLHTGIENSRRFRALPLFATLVSYGKDGYQEMMCRHILFAGSVASYLDGSPDWDVLTARLNIVLFAPSRTCRNARLQQQDGAQRATQLIKDSRRVYCSGTVWRGRPAIRLAVSNWMTTVERDLPIVKAVLEEIMQETR